MLAHSISIAVVTCTRERNLFPRSNTIKVMERLIYIESIVEILDLFILAVEYLLLVLSCQRRKVGHYFLHRLCEVRVECSQDALAQHEHFLEATFKARRAL